MPKVAKELSAITVRKLNSPGLHAVGGVPGLLLQVTESGAKSWILRTMVGSKRRDIGLGSFGDVPLASAREKARETKEQIRNGVDPVAQRKAAKAALIAGQAKEITFDTCVEQFLKFKTKEFRNPKHAAQWGNTLRNYASPVIGRLPVDSIELAHIVKILQPIWETKTETATRLRGRIESVLSWATVSGFRKGENPARLKGNLDAVLPKSSKLKNVQHFASIPWQKINPFMVALRQKNGISARALEFLILTCARSGEVRGAVWSEIDLKAGTWTIPAERMKASRQHIVPLNEDAIAILKNLPRTSKYIFPGARGGMLTDTAIAKPLKAINKEVTVHGFRSTFRDWCAESTNYAREVAEMALAHQIPDAVERAYRRGDLFTKRSRLMDDWCRYVNKKPASDNVTPIRKTK